MLCQPGRLGFCSKDRSMKLAVSGKGGVGKTTFVAVLARLFAEEGRGVIVIDADPDANLAATVGVADADKITPLARMKDLIRERTGSDPDRPGAFFRMNPTVSDLPEKLSVEHEGVRLMVLGAIYKGGGGCACGENALLRALLGHLVLQRDEVVIVDMEAGIEHLGRATVSGVDALIVVVEPGRRSIETALAVRRLAGEIGLRRVLVVGNKVRTPAHVDFFRKHLDDLPLLGTLSHDETVGAADLDGRPAFEASPKLVKEMRAILRELKSHIG